MLPRSFSSERAVPGQLAGHPMKYVSALPQVDHPNCIKLYAVYITGRKVYIVTELVTGGELLDRCASVVIRSAGSVLEQQQTCADICLLHGARHGPSKPFIHNSMCLVVLC